MLFRQLFCRVRIPRQSDPGSDDHRPGQQNPLANIACAGIHLEELAAGFLRSEKIITRRQDIENISLAKNRVDVLLKNKIFFRTCP